MYTRYLFLRTTPNGILVRFYDESGNSTEEMEITSNDDVYHRLLAFPRVTAIGYL